MSFFDQPNHDPTRRENHDPRISAWRDGHVNTGSSPGYAKMAQRSQSSALNSTASTVDGKTAKSVNAVARGSLPSHVRAFHNSGKGGESSWETEFPPPPNASGPSRSAPKPSAWTVGPPLHVRGQPLVKNPIFAGSASRLSGPDFTPSGPSAWSTAREASSFTARPFKAPASPSPSTKDLDSTPPRLRPLPPSVAPSIASKSTYMDNKDRDSTPPHLRPPPASISSSGTFQSASNDTKSCVHMNSGKVVGSAKHDSKFPCSYAECSRGFMTKKALKVHKSEEHDYCRVCDEDFDEFDELLEHKKYSERHISCAVCGEDFRSEAGRDQHQRQMHAISQDVKCPGCGYIFERGAGLIAHIAEDRCKARNGGINERVNDLKFRESRAKAGLYVNQLANRPSTTSAEIAAMQPSEYGDEQSAGGLALTPNLMDEAVPELESIESTSALTKTSNAMKGDDDTVTEGRSEATAIADWPTLEESKAKGKTKVAGLIQGLAALNVSGLTRPDPNAETLVPFEKPIPAIGKWSDPTTPDFRRNVLPSEYGSQHLIRTDWDAMEFERHGLDGNFHCPFTGCRANYVELNDLKYHLYSGYHQGTDNRCLKCLKIFKSPQALVAHMESPSNRCRMKETHGFGNVLHVVSGGFLGVAGRHEDGTIKLQAPDVPDDERHILHVDGEDDGDDQRSRLLLAAQRKSSTTDKYQQKRLTADEMLS